MTFLTIVLSVLLAVSTANVRMKQIEYRQKKNFYSNEQILSEIYNGIGKEASQCFSKAYASILSQTAKNGGEAVYQSEEEAFAAFSKNFISRLTKTYPEGPQNEEALKALNGYSLYSPVNAQVEKYDGVEIVKDSEKVPIQLAVCGITVKYKESDSAGNATGFESTITTDIVIDIPYVTFFRNSENLLDYALIGNKGVYFNGGNRAVTGNLYAGTDTSEPAANIALYRNEDVSGGLNFYNMTEASLTANYVISKGDVNVRKSKLTVGMDADSEAAAQIWAETFRTAEDMSRNTPAEVSEVLLEGQIFLANDLELNARESRVTLKGEYYGYNNGVYKTWEKRKLENSYVTDAHTQSSAMSINGSRSYLDLSGLNTFVVAGTAYIDLANGSYPEGGINGIEEYATGESLALRSNQYIYLAPQECLTGTNPCTLEESAGISWVEGYGWFGYNKGFINTMEPVIQKTYGRNGKKYTYFYLNFISEAKKKEYTELVLNMVEPERMAADMPAEILGLYTGFDELELMQIWEIKEAAQARAAADSVRSHIEVAEGADARIYTKGSIVKVKDGLESTQQVEDDKRLSVDYVSKVVNNLFKHYQYFCTSLDPKEDFPLLSDALPAVQDSEIEDDSRPFSVYIDMSPLVAGKEENSYRYEGKHGNCKTVIAHSDCVIRNSLSGIVICGGDVTVESGVNVEGLIIAAGRIYIKGDGKVEASRSVIQAILEEEYEEESVKETSEARNLSYASTYLKHYAPERKGASHAERITGTDYTDYISYRNWRKGE